MIPHYQDMNPLPHTGLASCAHPALRLFREALDRYGSITFALADLPDNAGITNLDAGIVFLHHDLTLGELNATVSHELNHLVDPDGTEDDIEARTAHMLIPHSAVIAVREGADIAEIAHQLGVDPALVRTRMRNHDDPDAHRIAS